MIKIRIKNADHEIDIRFPISESELFAKLGEIHAVEGRDVCPLDGRWYLSSWREKANFPPEKILQQNKEHKKRMPPNEGGIIRQWQR